jgi:hypothetical protein
VFQGRNWGQLDVSLVGTWLNSRRIEQLPGLGTYNCKGLFRLARRSPSLRASTMVSTDTRSVQLLPTGLSFS